VLTPYLPPAGEGRRIVGLRGSPDTEIVLDTEYTDAAKGSRWTATYRLDPRLFCVTERRQIMLPADPAQRTGTATHAQWADFRPISPETPQLQLPWQATIWECQDDGVCEDSLMSTTVVRVRRLAPLNPQNPVDFPVWLPPGAAIDPQTAGEAPEAQELRDKLYGGAWSADLQRLVDGQTPLPPPPEGLRETLHQSLNR
jgi:hypothetical protein